MTMLEQMKNWLNRYLSGACSLDEFQEWFAPALRDVATSEETEAEELAGSIVLAFSRRGNGAYTQEQLRSVLEQLLAPTALAVVSGYPVAQSDVRLDAAGFLKDFSVQSLQYSFDAPNPFSQGNDPFVNSVGVYIPFAFFTANMNPVAVRIEVPELPIAA
jgi:hypothetical protein